MRAKQFLSNSLLTLLAVTVAAPYSVRAEVPTGAPPPPDPTAIYAAAGANAEQLQAIRDEAGEFERAAKVRWELMMNLQKQMHELSLNTDPDEKRVLAKQDEISKAMAEMAQEKIKLMLKIRGMLTPQQKQKLVELMRARDQEFAKQGRAPNGHGHPPGPGGPPGIAGPGGPGGPPGFPPPGGP